MALSVTDYAAEAIKKTNRVFNLSLHQSLPEAPELYEP
tara:strand:- start:593 stop:706 length:114 start_codon:yes stop_codon:yes gene_type:complete